jgi:hypothetical protein
MGIRITFPSSERLLSYGLQMLRIGSLETQTDIFRFKKFTSELIQNKQLSTKSTNLYKQNIFFTFELCL